MSLDHLISRGLVHNLSKPPASASRSGFPFGLGVQGIHEIAETRHGDMAAAVGFVLAALGTAEMTCPGAPTLWVTQHGLQREHGRLLHGGARAINAPALPVLHVSARRATEALWAVEEALSSGAIGRIVAELGDADFTATRRLALMAGRHGVPAVLLMPHTREGTSAAAARWRIAAAPSAPNRLDPRAPGNARWRVTLERCRAAPHRAGEEILMEFCDETLRLHLVSAMAAGAPAPRAPGDRPAAGAVIEHDFASAG